MLALSSCQRQEAPKENTSSGTPDVSICSFVKNETHWTNQGECYMIINTNKILHAENCQMRSAAASEIPRLKQTYHRFLRITPACKGWSPCGDDKEASRVFFFPLHTMKVLTDPGPALFICYTREACRGLWTGRISLDLRLPPTPALSQGWPSLKASPWNLRTKLCPDLCRIFN